MLSNCLQNMNNFTSTTTGGRGQEGRDICIPCHVPMPNGTRNTPQGVDSSTQDCLNCARISLDVLWKIIQQESHYFLQLYYMLV